MSEEIKSLVEELKTNLPDYLATTGRTFNKDGFIKCVNPAHDDKNPSMGLVPSKTAVHCFSCGCTYDLIGLYQLDSGKDFLHSVSDLSEKYKGKPLDLGQAEQDRAARYIEKLGDKEAVKYLEERGIENAALLCSLGRVKSDKNVVYFPHMHFSNGSYLMTDWQARAINPPSNKARYRRSKGQSSLYDPAGAFEITPQAFSVVIVCEGEIDCLSALDIRQRRLDELKSLKAVALSSATNTKNLEAALDKVEAKKGLYGLLLLMDNDEAGDKATRECVKLASDKGFACFDGRQFFPEGTHDLNDAINKEDIDGFIDFIIKAATNFKGLAMDKDRKSLKAVEEYKRRYGAKNALDGLLSVLYSKEDILPIRTGFHGLDELLGGELQKGLMILGAPSSIGKTTFVLQIADQIAATDTRDIIYFTTEQAKEELAAKSISRLTYLLEEKGKDTKKTAYGVSLASRYKKYGAADKVAIAQACTAYEPITNRLYFIEPGECGLSADDIRKAVKDHIAITGNKPIVIVDYLQNIDAPKGKNLTDKQLADFNTKSLKRISAREKILIIAISSLSRSSYYEQASLEGMKESGGIEYGADYVLGLAFDWLYGNEASELKGKSGLSGQFEIKKKVAEIKRQERADIRLTNLKHRNGKTENSLVFTFYRAFNCFVERNQSGQENFSILQQSARELLKKGEEDESENTPF